MMVFLQDDVPARTAPATAAQNQKEEPADLLILGAGWTAEFLISYIEQHKKNFSYRTTTTNGGGRFDSIKFKFDPTDRRPPSVIDVIQLGSSGIFDGGSTLNSKDSDRREDGEREAVWIDRHSAYDEKNPRAGSEDELLRLNDSRPCGPGQSGLRTTVMNLSGLWGGTRNMRKYVSKVAPTKEILGKKTSIHMIHGLDVARAILAVLDRFALAAGQRWILTDQRVYDWWDLASAWENREPIIGILKLLLALRLSGLRNSCRRIISRLCLGPLSNSAELSIVVSFGTPSVSPLSAPGWNITPNVLLKDYPLPFCNH
ncbi:hypothetical protein H4Q26_013323 [Puccinia striiformis f. sp. tritici PST-130]|nr:hypothetical protein H4Q26_013323 [Puccinia striiformis f. sp. tritici PST-130]